MKAGYSYPIETLKHWYVAPIGGLSTDLKPGQIGLKERPLQTTQILFPQDRVSLSKLDGRDLGHFSPRSTLRWCLSIKLAQMPYPNPLMERQSWLNKRLGIRIISRNLSKWASL